MHLPAFCSICFSNSPSWLLLGSLSPFFDFCLHLPTALSMLHLTSKNPGHLSFSLQPLRGPSPPIPVSPHYPNTSNTSLISLFYSGGSQRLEPSYDSFELSMPTPCAQWGCQIGWPTALVCLSLKGFPGHEISSAQTGTVLGKWGRLVTLWGQTVSGRGGTQMQAYSASTSLFFQSSSPQNAVYVFHTQSRNM